MVDCLIHFPPARCSLTKVHAVLVVTLQQTQQQVPQMLRGLSGDAANQYISYYRLSTTFNCISFALKGTYSSQTISQKCGIFHN